MWSYNELCIFLKRKSNSLLTFHFTKHSLCMSPSPIVFFILHWSDFLPKMLERTDQFHHNLKNWDKTYEAMNIFILEYLYHFFHNFFSYKNSPQLTCYRFNFVLAYVIIWSYFVFWNTLKVSIGEELLCNIMPSMYSNFILKVLSAFPIYQ